MALAGPDKGQTLVDWITEKSKPAMAGGGSRITPDVMNLAAITLGDNLLVNGSAESWPDGTTAAPDGWTLTGAGATTARNTTNVADGLSSADMTAALNTATDYGQAITISATQNTDLRGAKVTLSVPVRTNTANRVFVKLDDGVTSTVSEFHPGDSTFRTLVVTHTIDASATKIEASIEISSGASITATWDGAMLVRGQTPTAFVRHANDGFLSPRRVVAVNAIQTTSTSMAVITGMSLANVVLDGKQSVRGLFTCQVSGSDATTSQLRFDFRRDSTVIAPPQGNNNEYPIIPVLANVGFTASFSFFDITPAAGVYTYDARWRIITGGGPTGDMGERELTLLVVPQP